MFDLKAFVEKFQLARQMALETRPSGGLCGLELEWNLVDPQFRPLLTVGTGPDKMSFVDHLRTKVLSPWTEEYHQLEVFHWMIEWVTKPYYTPRGAVYEGRLLEAALINALAKVGRSFGEPLYYWHGNLLVLPKIGPDCVPESWHLAKRRYLQRCVDMYGTELATAGTHSNLSLPEPMLAWDFMHLSASERGDSHLDDYKNQVYITSTRLMRAFAAVFIAASASTPLQASEEGGKPVVRLTPFESVRNLTFPNPPALDVPDLNRSHPDYLRLSYDLVRSGVRFGNNNWIPVRARSQAEPVERLIQVTSDQLHDIYARGLFAAGETRNVEDMALQIERQNLFARIDLPMARVEVRTDDPGHDLALDIANLTLKHLLQLRFYADPDFARGFRYDAEDIKRARRNEDLAAREGLRGIIEDPLTAKPIALRDFLLWTLQELRPLAEALDLWEDLEPLRNLAAGAPSTAERIRQTLQARLGGSDIVPPDLLVELAEARKARVRDDVEAITAHLSDLGSEASKLQDFVERARDEVHLDPQAPVRFQPRPEALVDAEYADKTAEILALSQRLVRIPSVTACPEERVSEVHRAATFVYDYLRNHGVPVLTFDQGPFPAVLAHFPGGEKAPAMLCGHFDVVEPEPDDSQFEPRIEGDYLWGRGAADMKTVVSTYLVWMKDTLKKGAPYPPMNLLLVGNEENGELEPMGTPHVLKQLKEEWDYEPSFFAAGERTGEKGTELWGEVCTQNRGVLRFELVAHGTRGHSGLASGPDLTERLLSAREALRELFAKHLTLKAADGWQSQAKFAYIQVGTPGIFNITPDRGSLGVEIRPIPQDDVSKMRAEIEALATELQLEFLPSAWEPGVACDPENRYLKALLAGITAAGGDVRIGRKGAGTSARFAPGGQAVVWGQTGIGPHAAGERHYIPSIDPYYRALDAFAVELHKG
ncbi:MAG: M20/M25/M40 family metallo-hydrolase [Holophagaceae bacterium]|uniref:M20/M25/M40 family metallo-hydrolase n=1 Tax=Candidatus Geothrix skivensis TaxID=2954439 RepID=A0A9D7XII6_9BACT|nr:M20/M25/M40 family metallo-hydrolase [Candidatus Geothrix skivensis]